MMYCLKHFSSTIMHEKIVEIIVYLMAELKTNQAISATTFEDLSNQGYTDTEISAAFGWLADKSTVADHLEPSVTASKSSFRLLHDFEQLYISPQVYGYLLQMQQLGVLNHQQVETVIERCLMTGLQPVDMKTVKFTIGSLLFNTDKFDAANQRIFLNGTETIH
jgi:uncharacterized protein Smg (DUF494 family)